MGDTATVEAVRKEPAPTDAPAVELVEPPPLAYRTFSPKLAPGLTAAGGVLAVLGGLGAWVRATQVVSEGLAPEEVAVTYGSRDPEGLTIAALGVVAIVSALFWLRRRPLFKLVPALALKLVPLVASIAIIALVIWQLPLIDAEASALAADAIQRADFVSYHAGLGWGAWCLLAAGLSLFLGTFVGVLREFDLHREQP